MPKETFDISEVMVILINVFRDLFPESNPIILSYMAVTILKNSQEQINLSEEEKKEGRKRYYKAINLHSPGNN